LPHRLPHAQHSRPCRALVDREFHLTVFNSGPTEVRLLIILMNALIAMFGAPQWQVSDFTFTWADIAVFAFGVGMVISFVVLTIRGAVRLRVVDDADRSR
jgi:hypothetical protein